MTYFYFVLIVGVAFGIPILLGWLLHSMFVSPREPHPVYVCFWMFTSGIATTYAYCFLYYSQIVNIRGTNYFIANTFALPLPNFWKSLLGILAIVFIIWLMKLFVDTCEKKNIISNAEKEAARIVGLAFDNKAYRDSMSSKAYDKEMRKAEQIRIDAGNLNNDAKKKSNQILVVAEENALALLLGAVSLHEIAQERVTQLEIDEKNLNDITQEKLNELEQKRQQQEATYESEIAKLDKNRESYLMENKGLQTSRDQHRELSEIKDEIIHWLESGNQGAAERAKKKLRNKQKGMPQPEEPKTEIKLKAQ